MTDGQTLIAFSLLRSPIRLTLVDIPFRSDFMKRLLLALLGGIPALSATGADWPSFRGPDGTGLVAGALPVEWSAKDHIAWTAKVPGYAWSCPIVVGRNVFIASAVADGQPKPRAGFGGGGRPGGGNPGRPPGTLIAAGADLQPPGGGQRPGGGSRGAGPEKVYAWTLTCLNLDTGKPIWDVKVAEGKPKYGTHGSNTFASETPASDGERVYVYFGAAGTVAAYDLAGKLVWKKDLGVFPIMAGWGTSSSPIVHGGTVFIQCDNEEKSFLAALDAKTGEQKWKVDRSEKSNWSTPYVWKSSGRTDLVVGGSGKLRGYDPATGQVIWEMTTGGGQSNATPVGNSEMLVFGTGPGGGGTGGRPGGGGAPGGVPAGGRMGGAGGTLYAVKAGAMGELTKDNGLLWSIPRAAPAAATPILADGYVYCLARQGGMISCFDAKTGKPAYKDERIPNAKAFWASPWANGGRIFCLDEDGVTHVLKAGPQFEVVRTNALGKDLYWSSPACGESFVLFRGTEGLTMVK
jgi:outer membrane protein assembly factor BamB